MFWTKHGSDHIFRTYTKNIWEENIKYVGIFGYFLLMEQQINRKVNIALKQIKLPIY